ncbi:MAG TPA: hypothetical protein VF665_00125 [Longimicrobium sp.]|jgi:hypothetical protein|uniref:hypothetical protein n=1 Tax=Longimicrobium sp. TaxID=2029185 RepID=UPI002ED92FA6
MPNQPPGDAMEPVLPETSRHEPAARPWEQELLISGAVIFSLLQLPGWVDDRFVRARAHVDRETFTGVFLLYVYVKVSLYSLILAFLMHLGGRGYWVGLIGLESVYPQGIRWENTTYGPVTREVFRERLGRIQAHIDAADRFCSVLFPLAFSMVSLCAYSLWLMAMTAGLAYLGTRLSGDPGSFQTWFLGCVAVTVLVPTVAMMVDKRVGARAEPGGRMHRVLRRFGVFTYYLNAMPAIGVMFTTLFSNARRSMRYPMALGGFALLFIYVFAHDMMMREGLLRVGASPFYPEQAGQAAMAPVYYQDRRTPGEVNERAPTIQSEVIQDPYVRLFIPYEPMVHGESLPQRCPGVRPLNDGGVQLGRAPVSDPARTRALLACWTRLQPVSLNGRVITPAFRFTTDPETGVRGIVAHIPVAGLPRGENLLTVAPPPRTERGRKRGKSGRVPAYIYFWL